MTAPPVPREKKDGAPQHMSPLVGYLTEQIGLVLEGLGGLRDGTDPIHDTRVAIRRTRSTLRVFNKQLDPEAGPAFEEELKWFAGVLGEVRDVQVQQQRLRDALDDAVTATRHAPAAPVGRDEAPMTLAQAINRALRDVLDAHPGAMVFGEDVAIRQYGERSYSIVHWSEFGEGGHFAALETPSLLVRDMRTFFSGLTA